MSTIDYGIDLGTTNSAIAVQRSATPTLVPGEEGELLPSAVHVARSGAIAVGARARAELARDPANTAVEFKRQMGTDTRREFPASGKVLSPEELSTEVLRALCARVAAADGEAPRAAVITVPAMFHLPQCDATRRAAALAGIEQAPLLQEPIAAAIAHSGAGEVREGSWLVYDLGGGTFDVSLVRCREGRLQVIDHDGDNHLGGRDFDRALARVAVERLREDGRLGELKRTDPGGAELHARIKVEAERVRLALSRDPRASFCIAEGGVEVSFELDRDDLESLLLPTIRRTTALCTRLLVRNRLEAAELSGLVLVGGPTMTSCLPSVVSDGVGIEARHYGDPMTIVARGAALFASTQRLQSGLRRRRTDAALELQLEFESMTTDPSPMLVGRVLSPPRPDLAITIVRDDGGFTSPPSPVAPTGAFAVDLQVMPARLNSFEIHATSGGAALPTEPDRFKILHGFSVGRPPLSQSIGIVLADNSVVWYLRKGAMLPARHSMTHTTTLALKRGQSGEAVHVALVQGESSRGDRNKVIGVLHIHAERIDRDLPAGSSVEVSIAVDESAQTTGRAYVPALDQWFDDIVRFDLEAKAAEAVGASLEAQRERLASLAALADALSDAPETDDPRLADVEALLEEGDRDSIDLADQMVRLMSVEIDAAEAHGRKAAIETSFEKLRHSAGPLIDQHGEPGERRTFNNLVKEIRYALERGDLDAAEAKCEDLDSLETSVMVRQPGFWHGFFLHLYGEIERHGMAVAAAPLIRQGDAAIEAERLSELPPICFQLMKLLPAEVSKALAPSIRSDIK